MLGLGKLFLKRVHTLAVIGNGAVLHAIADLHQQRLNLRLLRVPLIDLLDPFVLKGQQRKRE